MGRDGRLQPGLIRLAMNGANRWPIRDKKLTRFGGVAPSTQMNKPEMRKMILIAALNCHGPTGDGPGRRRPYPNCSAVRAAGATPIYKGEPGYRRQLDRDNDGNTCE